MKKNTNVNLVFLFLYILLLSLLSSCGNTLLNNKNSGGEYYTNSDSQFQNYIANFESYGKMYLTNNFTVKNIAIKFGYISNPLFNGLCQSNANGTKKILIRQSWWNSLSSQSILKEEIIFHEMGHCVLNRNHDNTILYANNRSIKRSLMHEMLPTSNIYSIYRAAFIKELFTKDYSNLYNSL